jgi:ankyrin repeat protein
MICLLFILFNKACIFGYKEIVKILLSHDADLNIQNKKGFKALDLGNSILNYQSQFFLLFPYYSYISE